MTIGRLGERYTVSVLIFQCYSNPFKPHYLVLCSFPNVYLDSTCVDNEAISYDDEVENFIEDNLNKFYCGATYADAANCGKSCGETGLDSECDYGEWGDLVSATRFLY